MSHSDETSNFIKSLPVLDNLSSSYYDTDDLNFIENTEKLKEMIATFNDVLLDKTIFSWEHVKNISIMKSKRKTKSKNLSLIDSKVTKRSSNANYECNQL